MLNIFTRIHVFLQSIYYKILQFLYPNLSSTMEQMLLDLINLSKTDKLNPFKFTIKDLKTNKTITKNFIFKDFVGYSIDGFCLCKILESDIDGNVIIGGSEYITAVDKVFFKLKYGNNITPIYKKIFNHDFYFLIIENTLNTTGKICYKLLQHTEGSNLDINNYKDNINKTFKSAEEAEIKGIEATINLYKKHLIKQK